MLWAWSKSNGLRECNRESTESIITSSLFVVANGEDVPKMRLAIQGAQVIPHGAAELFWMASLQKTSPKWIADKDPNGVRGSCMCCGPSPPSDARYRAWIGTEGICVGVQHMQTNGKACACTSSHVHFRTNETWIVVDGNGVLYTRRHQTDDEWTQQNIATGNVVHVSRDTEHQLRTDATLATVLVMETELLLPERFPLAGTLPDHTFVPPPS